MSKRDKEPDRPNYFETSSPFETYKPGGGKPRTYPGIVDRSIVPTPGKFFPGPDVTAKIDPEQYDNPRGYPGLSMVMSGDQKPRLPFTARHDITNHMSGSAKLARTGKPGKD